MAKRSPMAALVGAIDRPHEPITLDATDMALLRALAADSRLSQRALARQVNMSAPAVAERIARLERLGVIRGYSVDVDWDRLGFDVVVFMPIILDSGSDLEPTIESFRQIPELEELMVTTGQYDLLARFRLSGHAHLRELLLDRLWQIPNVKRFETMLTLGSLVTESYTHRVLSMPDGDDFEGEDPVSEPA